VSAISFGDADALNPVYSRDRLLDVFLSFRISSLRSTPDGHNKDFSPFLQTKK